MPLDENTPVLVGAGAVMQREDDPARALEAVALMEAAARNAARDAGTEELLAQVSCIRVTNGIWDYPDPARILADRLGAADARSELIEVGILQTTVLAEAAARIAAGEDSVVLVVGGEAKYRSLRAAITGTTPPATEQPAGTAPDRFVEPAREIMHPLELEFGLGMPVNQYAMMESAFRSAHGESLAENRRRIGELYSDMSRVAAGNEAAWARETFSAEEISEPSPRNRMLAFPYTKRHNSQWNVDQAACLILTSVGRARALGVPEDRFVFPQVVADSNHMASLVERGELHRCHGFHLAGQAALGHAGLAIEDVDRLELYSCFPIAVRAQIEELGVPEGRPVTQCGGMAFAGGPLNNFVFQAMVRMVEVLRGHPGEVGLVSAVSGHLTKQGVSLWSTQAPAQPFAHLDVADAVRAVVPMHEVASGFQGRVRIVANTVQYAGEDAVAAIFVCDLPDGRRTLASSSDAEILRRAVTEELCGTWAEIGPDGFRPE